MTDYIKTKKRVERVIEDLEILKLQLNSIKNKKKVIKLFDEK